MSSTSDMEEIKQIQKGAYHAAHSSDLRGPCPMINALANHGYLPRDGRNVLKSDFYSALNEIPLSTALGMFFVEPVYLEHKSTENDASKQRSFLSKAWYYITNPLAIAMSGLGLRDPYQVNSNGQICLNLDQLSRHNAIEHDVSLSRLDFAQGDNYSIQKKLVAEMLAASSDGGQTLTMKDLAEYRKKRIETQKQDNKDLLYGKLQHELGCGEISLILNVLGDGQSVRCDYLKAFFEEERLPREEGWQKKDPAVGLIKVKMTTNKVKDTMGLKF